MGKEMITIPLGIVLGLVLIKLELSSPFLWLVVLAFLLFVYGQLNKKQNKIQKDSSTSKDQLEAAVGEILRVKYRAAGLRGKKPLNDKVEDRKKEIQKKIKGKQISGFLTFEQIRVMAEEIANEVFVEDPQAPRP